MKQVLQQLFERKPLSRDDARQVLCGIARGEYPAVQVAAFMAVYRMRSVTVDEFEGFREAMLELCTRVERCGVDAIDSVGTGGDGKDTFNISTAAALVVAGAGQRVAKHGNYGASSPSGSSNVLEALGVPFRRTEAELLADLERTNFCFMHAPFFHPAMKNVAPIRKELSVRTFMNLLGPIANPATPAHAMIGVCSYDLLRLYAYLLQRLKGHYAVVHSFDGYDEISLTGAWKVVSRDEEQVFEPRDIGVETVPPALLQCESVERAVQIMLEVLGGTAEPARIAVVVANAAFALRTARPELSLQDAFGMARESLESGRALRVVEQLRAGC